MLPAPESLLVYRDAYVARRRAGAQAADVGRQLGQLAEAGKIHIFLIAWTEVVGGQRIPGGLARLHPSAWTIDYIDNPEAWFDPRVCEMSGDVEQILHTATSSGLVLTPNCLRHMCWGPIQLHQHHGEQAWVQAFFDDAEPNGDKLAHASPAPSVLPVSAAGDRQELVHRMHRLNRSGLRRLTNKTLYETTLEEAEYQHILGIIESMVKVMERIPKAFHNIDEESLRMLFLMSLNGPYKGQATGETFNYEGKTDILIRSDDRNIFIGECKFWNGSSGLTRAIDQVLGYLSWRDSRAAILLFNRNRDFSKVLATVPEVVRAHSHFKKDEGQWGSTGFRYAFRHKDDAAKILHLTIMAFDIPRS